MDYDVLVVGRPTCDTIFTGLSRWPEPGRENYADGLSVTAGGAFNFAAAARRLSLKVAFAGIAGNDLWSRFVCEEFGAEGIDTGLLKLVDRPLPAVSVAVNADGDRGFITHESDTEAADAAMLDHVLEVISRVRAGYVHLHLVPWLAAVARAATDRGMKVSVDTWGYEPWLTSRAIWDLAPLGDVLSMNDAEAITMTGAPDVYGALEELGALSAYVVIKCGARGAMAAVEGRLYEAPTAPLPVLDATGAGDCFNAGLLYGLLKDLSPECCLALGNICGGLSVGSVGGYSGAPSEAELLEAARRLGLGVPPPRAGPSSA